MIADAHVHVGYFNCHKSGGVEYYSPRRVIGVLNRCGVDEFVVSSTSAQAAGITAEGLLDEACEVKRIAGNRARQFLWVSWALYESAEWLSLLNSGLYVGIKLHEQEGHWVERHGLELSDVLDVAGKRGSPVQFHAGLDAYCKPDVLMRFANSHHDVRFDFAHCRPMCEMAAVIAQCDNVWTDTAYMALEDFSQLPNFDWRGRLMFGSDIPVWRVYENVTLPRRYQDVKMAFLHTGLVKESDTAFRSFLHGV